MHHQVCAQHTARYACRGGALCPKMHWTSNEMRDEIVEFLERSNLLAEADLERQFMTGGTYWGEEYSDPPSEEEAERSETTEEGDSDGSVPQV